MEIIIFSSSVILLAFAPVRAFQCKLSVFICITQFHAQVGGGVGVGVAGEGERGGKNRIGIVKVK